MRINIKIKNITLDTTVRNYVHKKLIRPIEKLIGSSVSGDSFIDIELARSTSHHRRGHIWQAEIYIDIGGTVIRARAVHETILSAIDDIESEIIREIKKFKSKQRTKQRKGARRAKKMSVYPQF